MQKQNREMGLLIARGRSRTVYEVESILYHETKQIESGLEYSTAISSMEYAGMIGHVMIGRQPRVMSRWLRQRRCVGATVGLELGLVQSSKPPYLWIICDWHWRCSQPKPFPAPLKAWDTSLPSRCALVSPTFHRRVFSVFASFHVLIQTLNRW